MNPSKKNRLPHIARRIQKPYHQVWLAVTNGSLPAENINGHWFVDEDDIPGIIEMFAEARPLRRGPRSRPATSPITA
jgi:hypothetical protein